MTTQSFDLILIHTKDSVKVEMQLAQDTNVAYLDYLKDYYGSTGFIQNVAMEILNEQTRTGGPRADVLAQRTAFYDALLRMNTIEIRPYDKQRGLKEAA